MMYDAYLLVLLALKEVVTHTQTDGQTDGQTDRQTDICLSRAAFAAENNNIEDNFSNETSLSISWVRGARHQ